MSSYLYFINAGVSHGCILRPLVFLIYIYIHVNNIAENIGSSISLDTRLYILVIDPNDADVILNSDFSNIQRWAADWCYSILSHNLGRSSGHHR